MQAIVDAAVAASESSSDTWSHRQYDVRTAMKAAFGMAFWLALDSVLDEPPADLDATADQLAEILFEGLEAR